jgi:hypothetical protein
VLESAARREPGIEVVPSQIIFKREQERTAAQPLTYREYIYLVPQGTSEASAELLLQQQLDLVRTSLTHTPAGKLIHLAAFDVQFHGKPPVPPIATLTWKDWLDQAVVALPRRGGAVASIDTALRSRPAPISVTPTAAGYGGPSATTGSNTIAMPPTSEAPNGMVAFATDDLARAGTAVQDERAPAQPGIVAAQPVIVPSEAVIVPAEPEIADAGAIAPGRPAMVSAEPAIVAAEPGIAPTGTAVALGGPGTIPADLGLIREPAIEPRRRARGEDLIADLFEAMHELHFLRDAVEGGAFCLALCIDKIPCHAGVVHLYDIDRREFLVTNTRGAVAKQLLLRRTPEADPVLSAATRRRHAIAVTYADESEALAIDRYAAIGGGRRVLVAPVMQAGRYLGALELIDPLDGQPFTETEVNAMTYIAGQFADFVEARGVVTDPDRIAAPQR